MPDFGKRADDLTLRWEHVIETALEGDGYVYFNEADLTDGQTFEQLRGCVMKAAPRHGVRANTHVDPGRRLEVRFYRSG